MQSKLKTLSAESIASLELSPEVKEALQAIQAEVSEAYRDSFIEMTSAIRKQASALDRIQSTLEVLVRAVKPELAGEIPAAIRIAGEDEEPDLASAVVVADPIGSGYTLSQAALARAVGCNPADVSVLLSAFHLREDSMCAVTVREGKLRDIVNYHKRAVIRFLTLVDAPPNDLDDKARSALMRAKKSLGK